jgi:hypothetical protein
VKWRKQLRLQGIRRKEEESTVEEEGKGWFEGTNIEDRRDIDQWID